MKASRYSTYGLSVKTLSLSSGEGKKEKLPMSGAVRHLKIQYGCLTKEMCIGYVGNSWFSSYRIYTDICFIVF